MSAATLKAELSQHLYSSVTRLRTVGASAGLPDATRRELEGLPDYELPPGVAPRRAKDAAVLPGVFRFFELAAAPGAGRCFALCRSGYVGQDRSGRAGNYVNHSVLLPLDVLEALAWDLPGLMAAVAWQRASLDAEPGLLPPQRVTLARGWPTSDLEEAVESLGPDVFSAVLDAVFEAHARDLPVYLCGLSPARAPRVLRAIWQALPATHRAATTFVTYAPRDDARLLSHGRRPLRLALLDPGAQLRCWARGETLARVGELVVQAAERFVSVTFPGAAAAAAVPTGQWAPRVHSAPSPSPLPAPVGQARPLARWTTAEAGGPSLGRWMAFSRRRRLAPKPTATEALHGWWRVRHSEDAAQVLRRAEALVSWCGDEARRAWLREDLADHLEGLPPGPEVLPLLELWAELLVGSAAGFDSFTAAAAVLGTLLERDAPNARVLEALGRCGPVAARHPPLMALLLGLLQDASPRLERGRPADHQALADAWATLAAGLGGRRARRRILARALDHLWRGRCPSLFVALLLRDPVAWTAMEARHGLDLLLRLPHGHLEVLVDGLWRRLLLGGPVGMTALPGVRFQGAREERPAPAPETEEVRLARLLCEMMAAGPGQKRRMVAPALFRVPSGDQGGHRRLLSAAGRIWRMQLGRPLEAFPHPHLQLELMDELTGAPPALDAFETYFAGLSPRDLQCFYAGLEGQLRQASRHRRLRLLPAVWRRLQLDDSSCGRGCFRWLLEVARQVLLPATLQRGLRRDTFDRVGNGRLEPLEVWAEICAAASSDGGRIDALFREVLQQLLGALPARGVMLLGQRVRERYPVPFERSAPRWGQHLSGVHRRRGVLFGRASASRLFLR